jgi:hypothetical protein
MGIRLVGNGIAFNNVVLYVGICTATADTLVCFNVSMIDIIYFLSLHIHHIPFSKSTFSVAAVLNIKIKIHKVNKKSNIFKNIFLYFKNIFMAQF